MSECLATSPYSNHVGNLDTAFHTWIKAFFNLIKFATMGPESSVAKQSIARVYSIFCPF